MQSTNLSEIALTFSYFQYVTLNYVGALLENRGREGARSQNKLLDFDSKTYISSTVVGAKSERECGLVLGSSAISLLASFSKDSAISPLILPILSMK